MSSVRSLPQREHGVAKLPCGTALEYTLSSPPIPAHVSESADNTMNGNKLAVCLHPWSWLGGRMDDPVLSLFVQPLHEHGYYVLRYNSRSVGKSSGWPSLTGTREAQDLRELVRWAADLITSVRSVVVIGYSYGALIASLLPLSPELKISHVLLSYPQGPRHWLTAFHGGMYDTALNSLLHDPQSNVLVLYGDHDEFTSVEAYDIWTTTLVQDAGDRRNLSIVKIVNGTHFWREFEPMNKMVDTVSEWLP